MSQSAAGWLQFSMEGFEL